MSDRFALKLGDRGVLRLGGDDRVTFLQGLVSNDVRKATPARAIYGTLLSPQGKFLHDFFLAEKDGAFLLECEGERRDDLRKRLSRFRLRSKIELDDWTDAFTSAVLVGADAPRLVGIEGSEPGTATVVENGLAFVDPRRAELGVRLLLPSGDADAVLANIGLPPGTAADYERLRLSQGVPDGSRDMPVEKAFLLESGIDELNGIDWQKGCYMGQELTARTKYRGLVRKRLLPVTIEGPLPASGTPVTLGEKQAGEMRSAAEGLGLALLRLELVDEAARSGVALTAGEARLTPHRPAWMRLPEPAASG